MKKRKWLISNFPVGVKQTFKLMCLTKSGSPPMCEVLEQLIRKEIEEQGLSRVLERKEREYE